MTVKIPAQDGYPEMTILEGFNPETGRKAYAIVPSELVTQNRSRVVIFLEKYWWVLLLAGLFVAVPLTILAIEEALSP